FFFFFQAEDGIRDLIVTGVQTCALPISAGGSAELRDRDGGRVARQHGFRPAQQTQLPEEVAFERDVLRDGFDDERDLIEIPQTRSEERRVGKECRYRGAEEE